MIATFFMILIISQSMMGMITDVWRRQDIIRSVQTFIITSKLMSLRENYKGDSRVPYQNPAVPIINNRKAISGHILETILN